MARRPPKILHTHSHVSIKVPSILHNYNPAPPVRFQFTGTGHPFSVNIPKTHLYHNTMPSSGTQHRPVHNQQGRRRHSASSLQSRNGPAYNSYELLSTSSFTSNCLSYSETDRSQQNEETHAESSSSATVKSESPPTDSSHVSKDFLKPHNRRTLYS